jgi:hypothetical protein
MVQKPTIERLMPSVCQVQLDALAMYSSDLGPLSVPPAATHLHSEKLKSWNMNVPRCYICNSKAKYLHNH